MKKKILLSIAVGWIGLMGFVSPVWIGATYMSISGHGKGYDYNLGSEVDISIMFGVFLLILWSALVVPLMIWSCNKFSRIKNKLVFIPISIFAMCFLVCLFLLGISEFMSYFNVAV